MGSKVKKNFPRSLKLFRSFRNLLLLGTISLISATFTDDEETASAPTAPLLQFSNWIPVIKPIVSVTCEESYAHLSCAQPGFVLFIERALFGRLSSIPCLKDKDAKNIASNVFCGLEEAEASAVSELVRARCHARTSCDILASVNTFNDSCPEVTKYLEINYKCAPPLPQFYTTTIKMMLTKYRTTESPTNSSLTESPTHSSLTTNDSSATLTTEETLTSISTETSSSLPATSTASPPSSATSPPPIFCNNRNYDDFPIPVGTEVRKKCDEGEGFEIRICSEEGRLKLFSNETYCLSPKIKKFEKIMESNKKDSQSLITELVNITSEDALTAGDIRKTSHYLKKLRGKIESEMKKETATNDEAAEVVEKLITVGDSLIDQASWKRVPKTLRSETAMDIVTSMEATAFILADFVSRSKNDDNETTIRSITKNHVHVEIAVGRRDERGDLVLPGAENVSTTDSVAIPMKNFQKTSEGEDENVKVVFLSFTKLGGYLSNENDFDDDDVPASYGNDTVDADWTVNTNIMTASIDTINAWTPLEFPVTLSFRNQRLIKAESEITNSLVKCVFWNNYNNSEGTWSSEGCELVTVNSSHTICSCDHLTSFTVLMDFNAVFIDHSHELSLMVITYAGSILSIICLTLAFATFCLLKNLQCERNTLHKNLCISLLAAEIVFVTGIDKTHNHLLCSSIAALLHFFFLASFAWMSLEGFQLYLMLIKVFEAKRSRMKWYYLFGYGLPLVIVATTVTFSETMHDTTRYGTNSHCWLSYEDGFVFAFVAPVILALILNLAFFILAFYQMCTHSRSAITRNHEYSVWTWIKGAAVLIVLLGLTWSTGLLFVNENSIVMAYIFTVSNSLQGLFIFVFHCCNNEKVRKEYSKAFQRNVTKSEWFRNTLSGKESTQSRSPPSTTNASNFLIKWLENGLLKKSKSQSDNVVAKKVENGAVESREGKDSGRAFFESSSPNTREDENDELGILSTIDASVVDSEFVTDYLNGEIDHNLGENEADLDSSDCVYQEISEYSKSEPVYAVLEPPYPTGAYEVSEIDDFEEYPEEPAPSPDADRRSDDGNPAGVIAGPVSFRVKQNGKSPAKIKPKSRAYSPQCAFLQDGPSRGSAQIDDPRSIQLQKYVRRSGSPTNVMTTSIGSNVSTSLHSSDVNEDHVTEYLRSGNESLPDVTKTYHDDRSRVQYSHQRDDLAQKCSSQSVSPEIYDQRDYISLCYEDVDGIPLDPPPPPPTLNLSHESV